MIHNHEVPSSILGPATKTTPQRWFFCAFYLHMSFFCCTFAAAKVFRYFRKVWKNSLLLNLNAPFCAATFWGISAHITVGDLDAEDHGKDETYERENCQHVHMLVTRPIERHIFAHEFKVSHERDCADKQKQGDKHRR